MKLFTTSLLFSVIVFLASCDGLKNAQVDEHLGSLKPGEIIRLYKIEAIDLRNELNTRQGMGLLLRTGKSFVTVPGSSTTSLNERVFIAFRSLSIDTVYTTELNYDEYFRDVSRFKFKVGDTVVVKWSIAGSQHEVLEIRKAAKPDSIIKQIR